MKFTADKFAKAAMTQKPAALYAASTLGTVVDCLGYREALVVALFGTAAAGAEADVTILEGDLADGSYVAPIATAAFVQVTPANDDAVYVGRLDLTKRKRYLRSKNVGDGANAADLAVVLILLDPVDRPASQTAAVSFSL